jgi:hypothetical protein
MSLPMSPEEKRMVDYLLGRLPDAEREIVAGQLLTDDEVYQAMLATEELLIDHYAAGELDAEDARLAELMLLRSESGKAKLRTAQAFLRRHQQAETRQNRGRWLAAAAILLVGVGLSATVFQQSRKSPEIVASKQQAPLGTFELALNVYRDKSTPTAIDLPHGNGMVAFVVRVDAADRSPEYQVRLRTAGQAELSPAARETADSGGYAVRFELDRAALAAGRYEVEVAGAKGLIAYGPVVFRN